MLKDESQTNDLLTNVVNWLGKVENHLNNVKQRLTNLEILETKFNILKTIKTSFPKNMDFKAKRKLNKKNQQSTQENSFLMESLKVIGNILNEEQQKHIALEQHGRKEMIGSIIIKLSERGKYLLKS